MANGYIEVSKTEPCPICGTADYCCHIPAEDGYGEVRICKRYTDGRVICPGSDTPSKIDGEFYLLIAESHQGYGIYRSANDVQMAESNGFKVWRKGGGESLGKKGPGVGTKELMPIGINELASDELLDTFYRELICKYPLRTSHKEYLRKEGWSEELINNSMLCSFPVDDWMRNWHKNCRALETDNSLRRNEACVHIIRKIKEPIGIPGFYQRIDKKTNEKYWYINCRSGIGFPLYNDKGQIVRIRVRMDFLNVNKTYEMDSNGLFFVADDNKKRYVSWSGVKRQEFDGSFVTEKDKKFRCSGKYRGLSSFEQVNDYENAIYTNRYENGTEGYNIVGLISKPQDNYFMAILTEGEKKSIVGNDVLKAPFIIVPGVNSYNKLFDTRVGKNILEYLKQSGTELFEIAFDADKYENEMVLMSERGLVNRLLKEGLRPVILNWDSYFGKGLDDCIMHHGTFNAIELSNDNVSDYYSRFKCFLS